VAISAKATSFVSLTARTANIAFGGRIPDLITSDEAPAYETVIATTFSEPVPPPTPSAGPTAERAATRSAGLVELRDGA